MSSREATHDGGRDNLTISAGAAGFGDGQHPTTKGVLTALQGIDPAVFPPKTACDIGAGSGILSLAIRQRFGCAVLATDISKQAVETAKENAQANGIEIDVVQADGFAHPVVSERAPFDLITMNILAEPLLALAVEAERHLAHGGVLILSGILRWQETQITEAYQSLGLELTARIVIGDWVTLLWQK